MVSGFAGGIAAVAVVVLTAAAAAEAPGGAALRARGLQLGSDLDYDAALAAFAQAGTADPDDAAAFRLMAATAWAAQLFDQGAITASDYLGDARASAPRAAADPRLARTMYDAIGRALAIAERRVQVGPEDADAHYQLGAAYGVLASYTATVDGRVLGSLGPARRAYREHVRVLELDPRRKDAGLIVGTYRYAVGELPLPLRLAAHIAGFGGDRARGIRLIEDAANYAGDSQASALFVLVLIYNRESRFDDALKTIARLQAQFPRNRLLWLEAGSTALRAGRARDALVAIEQGLEKQRADSRRRAFGEDARWKYVRGAALVALHRGPPAERELYAALECPTRDWVRGRIHMELGKTADLAGDRRRALGEYRIAERLCDGDDDRECGDASKSLIRAPFR